tara:strand:+ start:1741 stop:2307 length:567 start_codon:yes stop_codon:yes gene_type:complete
MEFLLKKKIKKIFSIEDELEFSHMTFKGIEKIDFLLLLIESIEINGTQYLVNTANSIDTNNQNTNIVDLWKIRLYNPLRKITRRGKLSKLQLEYLVEIISMTAYRIYPYLRQLLSNKEPAEISNQRWELLKDRFGELVSERMNIKRITIRKILNSSCADNFIKELVFILAYSSGLIGQNRLKSLILDI